MKTDLDSLRENVKWSYEEFQLHRKEAANIWDYYNNRQWDDITSNILDSRGQPKETYNIIKRFCRMIVGYFTSSITQIKIVAKHHDDKILAAVATDVLQNILEYNNFDLFSGDIILNAIISGLFIAEVRPTQTEVKDEFGRYIYDIKLKPILDHEILLDPLSLAQDYSDARFIHRFKWLSETEIIALFGKEKVKNLKPNIDFMNIEESAYEYTHINTMLGFGGNNAVENNYLVFHSEIFNDKGELESIFWQEDLELSRKNITKDGFSLKVTKLHVSNKQEYYGLFREILETQKAINQALIKLQLLINTNRVFVEENSVQDMPTFINEVSKVTSVVVVRDLKGIKLESQTKEAFDQYVVIEKALERAQNLLNITKSFLGESSASDSGRKVKLQQNTTKVALNYIVLSIELFYRELGKQLLKLVKNYYFANTIVAVTDKRLGQRFTEINKPFEVATAYGTTTPVFDFVRTEEGEYTEDSKGNFFIAPEPQADTAIQLLDGKVSVLITPYADEDERNQLFLEGVLASGAGQMIAKLNPSDYLRIYALLVQASESSVSPVVHDIIMALSEELDNNEEARATASNMADNLSGVDNAHKQKTTKLPTNTNESI